MTSSAVAEHPVRPALLLGALGVVFGDIRTSPIFAFREALKATAPHVIHDDQEATNGAASPVAILG